MQKFTEMFMSVSVTIMAGLISLVLLCAYFAPERIGTQIGTIIRYIDAGAKSQAAVNIQLIVDEMDKHTNPTLIVKCY